jgi:transglutaminase-like putative cysteine protease
MKSLFLKFIAGLVITLIIGVFAFNGYPKVSSTDTTYIDSFLVKWNITRDKSQIHTSFENQVVFVEQVQDSIIKNFTHRIIPDEQVGDVEFYYKNKIGLCFDKSILMEKIFASYGFTVRHVFCYFLYDSNPTTVTDFFKRRLFSHALLEVKTQKGWMALGSNGNWVGIDSSNNPLTIFQVRDRLEKGNLVLKKIKPEVGANFFESLPIASNFLIAYGIYSRHGQFIRSSPVETTLNRLGLEAKIPDYNLRMLLYNL